MRDRKCPLRFAALLGGIVALLAVSAPALATPLLTGSSVDCFNVRAGSPWIFVADEVSPFSFRGITGTFNAWVFNSGTLANPALAFQFQAGNNSSSNDNGSSGVTTMNLPALGWFRFPLDVFYLDLGGTAPASANASSDSKRGELWSPAAGGTGSGGSAVQTKATDSMTGRGEVHAGEVPSAEVHSGEVHVAAVRPGEVHAGDKAGGTGTAWLPPSSGGESSSPSPVPEPFTLVLMGSGLVALGCLRTFKSRS